MDSNIVSCLPIVFPRAVFVGDTLDVHRLFVFGEFVLGELYTWFLHLWACWLFLEAVFRWLGLWMRQRGWNGLDRPVLLGFL